jgi:hypothetical protein
MITLFAYVYGNNLAIRGPAGSMLQALNGMLFERNEIIFAFVIMVIFYIISTNFSNSVIMNFEAAIVCQAIMLTFTLLTYRTTLRIYNRFKVKFYDNLFIYLSISFHLFLFLIICNANSIIIVLLFILYNI